MKFVLLLSAFFLYNSFLLVTAQSIFDRFIPDFASGFGFGKNCDTLGCPSGSTSCSRKISTSENRNEIHEEIKCFDAHGAATRDEKLTNPNPYPGTVQSGFETYTQKK